jgi:histidine triad (HIT) family protein
LPRQCLVQLIRDSLGGQHQKVDMGECVFCEIVAGRLPASAFYEDDLLLGLMTIGPVTEGHAMVIPKAHVASLSELDEATGRHLWSVSQRTAAAIRESGIRCEGINLFLADGKAAFQHVFHLHMHVFPRYRGDSFRLAADWDTRPPREELDLAAARIRAAYEGLWGG